jgi:hypothetical protein
MQQWAPRLRDDLGLSIEASNALATTIAEDVRALPEDLRRAVISSTPVALKERLDELIAFQSFMDIASAIPNRPALTRAQVIVQNYVCFVYLGDSCFRVLRRGAPTGSTVKRCCRFLTDNPVRAFRNAVAHGNWQYAPDFSGLIFWARKGDDRNQAPEQFQVSQNELNFWQSLARVTAYAAYVTLGAS